MASYRPQLKTSNGLVDFPLDAETVKGKTILEQTYPVGAIYISTNSTSPASLFGGTWQQIKDTFILAAGDTYTAGATGGEATHQLTINEMPSHSHNIKFGSNNRAVSYGTKGNWDGNYRWLADAQFYQATDTISIASAGSDGSHNNMPPYLVAYVWKRTA